LSGAQSGIWYAQQRDPANPAYNTGEYVEIAAPVDAERFATAVRRAVAEADALHVRFAERDGAPRQVPRPAADRPLELVDVGAESDPRAAAEAWMRADLARPVDLAHGPLFTQALFRLAPDRYLWFQRCHHVALDAYGYALIERRVAEIYTALMTGEPVPERRFGTLEALLDEDRAYRASSDFDRDRAFWTERLRGSAEPVSLAAGPARPAARSLRETAALPRTRVDRLTGRVAATWPEAVVAAIAGYLHRMTRSQEVVLGLPVMNRLGSASLRVPGMVVNVVPLRLSVAADTRVGDLVGQVAREMRRTRTYQRYRAEDLRRDLNLVGEDRPLTGPLVNIKPFGTDLDFAGHPGRVHYIAPGPVEDLSISVYEEDGAVTFVLDANPDRYDPAVLAEHRDRLLAFVSALCDAGPEQYVDRLPLLLPGERERLLPGGTEEAAAPATLPERFAARVRRDPAATALTYDGTDVTYGELNARANRLAHLLVADGAGPERLVALALPRSADLVVALLAVLKAGGGYLPIDPGLPPERISFMLADAGPVLVLADAERAAALPRDTAVPVRTLDAPETAARLAEQPADDPGGRCAPDDLAYVIYTSGSTGRPKGVEVPHHNVVRLFGATGRRFGFGPDDVWTLFHSYAFDFSVWEIWGALLHGGRLVVVPYEVTRDPAAFLRLLADQGVTVLNQTPSAFHELDRADREDPETGRRLALRYVVFGGEALDPRRLTGWHERHGDTALVNMYGITETTVHVTYAPLDRAAMRESALIGRPLPDLRVYVLDDELAPVPPGVPGELYVAGAGLARGYRGRPGLTAERFPPDPYGPPGARMYRTGDRARWRRDGGLDYLGRTDQQVKIRGFRVEPGEIEAALTRRDDVAQAAVLAREDRPGDRRLVAYVVPAGDGPDPADLRRDLTARLPSYLVPSAFVPLGELPLTANGKLDADALPAAGPAAEVRGRAARTPDEQVLCDLFAEVLGLPSVGIDDGFFALGGHSLLATRLIGRIRTALGVEPPIRALFEAPTVAGLAAHLHASGHRPAPRPVPEAERPAEIPLSPAQRRLWLLHRMEAAGPDGPLPAYTIPLAVRLTGDLDRDALDAALGDLVARHESLRTVFPERDALPYQRVLDPERPALEITDTDADRLGAELAAAARHRFDLAHEPPLRVRLFRLAPDEHVLLLVLHHIAGDDWSLSPLAADLSRAYAARRTGRAPDWAPLPVQYADYTLWQRAVLGDEDDPDSLIARRLAFWTAELAGLPDQLDLRADRPRPAVSTNRGGTVPVRIGGALFRRLRALADEAGASPFMAVQAALAGLLTRLGAGTDIPIGSPVAGREDAALDGLVGFFVNTLVLRTDTSGDPTFGELLRRVRDADLAAYEHQDLPFERLVEALNPARSLSRHPLFQIMLAYQHAEPPVPEMPGLGVRREPVDVRTAKFDLTFILTERGEEDGVDGVIEYSADLFDAATVARLAERLVGFLDAVTARPDRPVGEPDILSPAERHEMIVRWNDTARPITAPPLPRMFEEQAARTPDAEALVADGRRYTYAEVNARANRLAHHLRDLGVGPERTVGVHLARSAEMVVGLLAVLKAGGAFVPLEPSWPAERIAGIGRDARLTAVLTTPGGRGGLPGGLTAPAVELDPGWAAFDGRPSTDPPALADPDNLAYVIYTSGSTGAPKGAMIRHEAISNRLPWQQGLLGMTPDDAVLHKAPLTFDISVNEIFLPLVTGARLVVAERGTEGDTAHLLGLIARERVTFVYLVSSILGTMLERDDVATAGRSLRHVWCGGEVLTPELFARFRERLDATMYHGYGPAEATIGVTCQVYQGADPAEGITIGRPNPNTRVHVLDAGMRPVPAGVAGELYIGGVPLARGYLGDPAKTAEKFVPDPFGTEPGARLYRSGDLARYRADGNIEFLGRADNQIKIRGVRVELEEIEAVAARHPAVRQAVVLADGQHDATRLSAYCVAETGRPVTAEEVRDWLGRRLPEYMVPRDVHLLPAFPLMTSGKVDRTALAAGREPAPAVSAPYEAPRSGTERVIAEVWAELFGVERVGARDNFFDLGGHSLLLARVQTQLERRLGIEISMLDLFGHPTVAALAARLGEVASGDTAGGTRDALRILLPIRTEGTRPPLFLVHPAAGLSWPFAGLRKHIDEGYPLYGLQARGLDEPRPVAGSVEEMAAEYLSEVRAVRPSGPYHLVGWSFGGIVAHAMAGLLQDAGEEVGLLGMLDAFPSYPWEKLADDHEQEALRSLLYMSHYDLDTLGDEPLTRARVLEVIRDRGGILADLRAATIGQIIDTFVNSAILQRKAGHRRIDGDLLFFTATVDPIDPSLSAGMWRPYVTGGIADHRIACAHKDMTQPGPLAEIGGIINRTLRERG